MQMPHHTAHDANPRRFFDTREANLDDGNGACVLVVEDDPFQAHELAERLRWAGFVVAGPAATAAAATRLLDEVDCDAAVLDVHLRLRETSEPVALELKARGLPFVTVTGYLQEQRPPAFDGVPVLSKPVLPPQLLAALNRCLWDAA